MAVHNTDEAGRSLLPLLGLGDLMAGMPIGLAMLEHLLFGEVVAIVFLPFQRSLPRRQLHPRHSL